MISTKRWDEPREPRDGWRLLICRFRPRGVSKAGETWDAWWPQLGPSKELHALVYEKVGEGIGWETYRRRYLTEMRAEAKRIDELAGRVAAGETITLLCSSSCIRESRCHRSLLKEPIEKAIHVS